MSKLRASLLIILLVIIPNFYTFGFYGYLAMNFPTSTFECIKNSGVTQLAFYLPHPVFKGDLEPLLASLMNAKNAGLKVELVYMACRELDPTTIVENLKRLSFIEIDRYWVTPHNFTAEGCGWGKHPQAQNCQYLQQLRDQMSKNNLPFGITSNSQMWNSIFGTTCNNIFSNELLYWFPYPNINSDATLSHFVPFAGWYKAYMKPYTCSKICNLDTSSGNYCNSIFM